MKKWLSSYRLSYPRSLVYMLQASEYNVRDYLDWRRQAADFLRVEKRKKFVKTAKGLLLLGAVWMLFLGLVAAAGALFWVISEPWKYLLIGLILVLLPYFLAYGLAIFTGVVKIAQLPLEKMIIAQARKKLQAHPAIKIGIAGSFGKTTMREILKTVLSEGKKVAAPPHSYNTLLGISQFVKTLSGDEEVIVFELGEYYPGDVQKLCQLVQPDIGVITGVNEAHLQKFKTIDRTVKTIYELADYLGDRPVYVNAENQLAADNAAPEHILYSRRGVGGLEITTAKTDLSGTSLVLQNGQQKLKLKSELLGLHLVGSLGLAVELALKLNLNTAQIKAGISNTKPFEHRLQPKTDNDGVVTLDDSYNGNPDGVRAVIDFLGSLKNHRRFYVTPGLVEIGAQTKPVHLEIGKQLAEAQIEKVVLIKNSVTPFIEEGLKKANYQGEIIWFDDALKAFAALPRITVKGDVVLLQNDWPDQYR